ncbi:MAG TPA: hypothetical protein DCO80_15400 [Ornithinibacillus sp.]|nr:hypothetical protein [Ornithinibacillus sp.]
MTVRGKFEIIKQMNRTFKHVQRGKKVADIIVAICLHKNLFSSWRKGFFMGKIVTTRQATLIANAYDKTM